MPQPSRSLTVWLTGLPGSGKSTSAEFLIAELKARGVRTSALDGDSLREGISADLGFSEEDRSENVRRAGEIALLLASAGAVVVVSLVSPRRVPRAKVRRRHLERGIPFLEVYIAAPIEVCELRDPKALYRKARYGTIQNMTGVDDAYEPPLHPELILATDIMPIEKTGHQLVDAVMIALGHPEGDVRTDLLVENSTRRDHF